jgi:polar amino acid transport system substrate-binding protein
VLAHRAEALAGDVEELGVTMEQQVRVSLVFETTDAAAELVKLRQAETIRAFDNFAVSFQALRAGQLDAAISIDSTGKEYDDRGEFTRAISGLYGTPINFGFRSRVLAQAVADALTAMKADGSFQALLDKFGVTAYNGPFEVVGPS